MKTLAATLAASTAIACGWVLVGSLYSRAEAGSIRLEPVVHAKYNPVLIDRDIAFHQRRVKEDPGGAIGWQLLSGAYLARSRESDSDQFAWKAEDAATKSLELRTRRNQAAWMKLVQSLLEQHRFQDALAKTEEGIARFPDDVPLQRERADVLVEVGRLDDAERELAKLPMTNRGAESAPILARIASIRGDHQKAIELYRLAMDLVASNMATPQAGIAWYVTKIGTEQELSGDHAAAKASFDEALRLYPRSYKAWLGEARVAIAQKRYDHAIVACNETLKIANSLDAVAMRGDARLALGHEASAQEDYAMVREMYRAEVSTFDSLGKGGRFHVKPIDRQFATFAASHRMYADEALAAARRDHENRPDEIAVNNLKTISEVRSTK